jgi:hypothetical protein
MDRIFIDLRVRVFRGPNREIVPSRRASLDVGRHVREEVSSMRLTIATCGHRGNQTLSPPPCICTDILAIHRVIACEWCLNPDISILGIVCSLVEAISGRLPEQKVRATSLRDEEIGSQYQPRLQSRLQNLLRNRAYSLFSASFYMTLTSICGALQGSRAQRRQLLNEITDNADIRASVQWKILDTLYGSKHQPGVKTKCSIFIFYIVLILDPQQRGHISTDALRPFSCWLFPRSKT